MNKEVFFVNIREPLVLRRAVLESSRETIRYMQHYEQLKAIRTLKTQKIMQIKKDIRDINKLINELKAKLPAVNIRERKEKPKHEYKKKVKEHIKHKPHKSSELEKLDAELGEVEKKLGKLR